MEMWCLVLLGAVLAAGSPVHDQTTPRAGEACGYESCTSAEEGMLNVHIVAHTHDDVGWLKTVDQYYYGSRNNIQKAGVQYILDSVVKELWEDPKRRFIYVETAFFWKWWVRQSDSVRHKVHVLVRQGRLQMVGGAWSMNDEAASHYQSTVDQFTWGLSKLNATFGACGMPHVGWQIDPFGHSREFASLLAGMGYDGLFLGRIDYQDKKTRMEGKTMEMLWRGDDDLGKPSDIFTGVLHNTYSPPPGFCFDVLCNDEPIIDDPDSPMYNVEARVSSILAYVSEQAKRYTTRNVLLTMGGDFTFQDAGMWYTNLDKLIQYTNMKAAKDGLNVKLFYSTPACYLKAVKDSNPTLPTKQDDFFPYASDPTAFWTGYFTSRPTTKYFEREGNNYLQMFKQLQVLAGLEEHNKFVLNELKSAMGIMQHHDAITGTEKQHVTHDYVRLLDQAIDDALIIATQAFSKMTSGGATEPPALTYSRCHFNESRCDVSENSEQFVVTVYNHLAWQVNDSIRIPVVSGEYAVYAPNGDQIVSQVVDLPIQVTSLPHRKSKATHEIVFIAYLHPVSFKSYYIKKIEKLDRNRRDTNDYKRKNDYYANINDYWKDIKDKTYIDIKNIEEPVDITDNDPLIFIPKIPDVPDFGPRFVNLAKDLDLDVLKDRKEEVGQDIEQLEKILRESRNMEVFEKVSRDWDKKVPYPNLNDDEMRMLSDDPMVVERFAEDVLLDNGYLKLRVNATTNDITHIILPDGTENGFVIRYAYYPGCRGNNENYANRSSGAYIFRPNATSPVVLTPNVTNGPKGPVLTEVRATFDHNVASFVRFYQDLKYVENEWIVGPIDIKDDIGKEFVVKYRTDIVNNGEFYTDSNGRQMLKRKLNQRPQWNVTLDEPIAGNYYPVTNKIYIEDANSRIAVLTDRSEGGSSLLEGEVELMLHRRLLHDDAFGVGEPLNETVDGKGLIVRGRHRIYQSKAGDDNAHIEEKKMVLEYHLQPQVFVSDAKDMSLEKWMTTTKAFSWVNALPEGIHMLTLEPWYGNSLLLRLENFLEIKDKGVTTIDVDLTKIFKTLTVKKFRETTLAANKWMDEEDKWVWNKGNEFSDSFNNGYGSFDGAAKAKGVVEEMDDGFIVKIKAKQIRTFVVDYELK